MLLEECEHLLKYLIERHGPPSTLKSLSSGLCSRGTHCADGVLRRFLPTLARNGCWSYAKISKFSSTLFRYFPLPYSARICRSIERSCHTFSAYRLYPIPNSLSSPPEQGASYAGTRWHARWHAPGG